MKRFTVVIVLFLIAIMAAACTPTGTAYPPTIPPRQVTAEPTVDTSIPTATVDPSEASDTSDASATTEATEAVDAAAVGGTFTTSDGKLSFSYPQGWFVQEAGQGQVLIVNNRAAFNSVPGAGQYQVNLVVSPIGEMALDSSDTSQASITALEALVQLSNQYQTTGTTISEPFEETMGGRPAYFVRISNATFESLLGMVEINATHIALAAVSSRGELTTLEPIARTIGASLQYTP